MSHRYHHGSSPCLLDNLVASPQDKYLKKKGMQDSPPQSAALDVCLPGLPPTRLGPRVPMTGFRNLNQQYTIKKSSQTARRRTRKNTCLTNSGCLVDILCASCGDRERNQKSRLTTTRSIDWITYSLPPTRENDHYIRLK